MEGSELSVGEIGVTRAWTERDVMQAKWATDNNPAPAG
jgi:hypothetical protein